MLYIYLDTSGDLGFDFANKKPSDFFTICVLVLRGQRNDRAMANAVKALGAIPEVKGGTLPLDTQKYFYKNVKGIEFGLYAVTLDNKKHERGDLEWYSVFKGKVRSERIY